MVYSNLKKILKMRKVLIILQISLLSLTVLASCNNSSDKNHENNKQEKSDSAATKIEEMIPEPEKKETAVCDQKEEKGPDEMMPNIIITCNYKNFKSVAQGFPDMKGRYSYIYEMFVKDASGQFKKVKNEAIFKKHKELLSRLNARIKADYDRFSKDEETKNCFYNSRFTPYTFDRLGIEFKENEMQFSAVFYPSDGACMSTSGTTVTFKYNEMHQYLIE